MRMLMLCLIAGCFLIASTMDSVQAQVPNRDSTQKKKGEIPKPVLLYTGKEDYKVGSNEFTRYEFTVKNRAEFPDELFKAAPELPAAGLNKNASRTFVDLCDANSRPLYGFVGLKSNADLEGIWFAVPKGQMPPKQVCVVLTDRKLKRLYKSDFIPLEESSKSK